MNRYIRFFALLSITLSLSIYAGLAQEFTEDDLIELSESYSFSNPFIGEITVSYPEDWMIEGDDASGGIFMGEELAYSETTGTVIGNPTNIMVVGYPSEVDISEYDEALLFEVYAESIISAMDFDLIVEGTLVEVDGQLMYYFILDLFGEETMFIFLHEDNEFIAIQATTQDEEIDLILLAISVAQSVELNVSAEDRPQPVELDATEVTVMPEGLVEFSYPSSWEVRDEPFDTEPVVISNDIDAFLEQQFPPLGVYGIRLSAHEISQNGLLARRSGSFSPEEILELVLGDAVETGLIDELYLENGTGIRHVQTGGGHAIITIVFDTDDNLTVFMQGVARARDVGQLHPILEAIVETIVFTPLFD